MPPFLGFSSATGSGFCLRLNNASVLAGNRLFGAVVLAWKGVPTTKDEAVNDILVLTVRSERTLFPATPSKTPLRSEGKPEAQICNIDFAVISWYTWSIHWVIDDLQPGKTETANCAHYLLT